MIADKAFLLGVWPVDFDQRQRKLYGEYALQADVITNLTSADTISLPTSEFASFAALTNAAVQSGANVVITASDGQMLTLKNMTMGTLAGMQSNFTFHA